jgi:hypothetical protein
MMARGKIAFVVSSAGVALVLVAAVSLRPAGLHAQSARALEAQHQRLLPLFELDGVVFTDADETRDRFVVGVVNRGLETAIRARLRGLGVPPAAVDVVVTEPVVEMADLRSRVRPLVGGLQLRFDSYLCTLGFNADLGAGHGFVVNSHCTTKESTVNGTDYFQPLDQVGNDYIGQEIIDPPFFQKVNGCPKGKLCRYSDAAYVQLASNLDPGTDADLGSVAKTSGPNNGSLVINGTFTITSELGGPAFANTLVNKVGRTTGWTQGRISNTCANTGVSGTRVVRLCQDFVDAGVGGGDSSSPVFKITSGDNVELYGILWGGNQAGTMFVYSPLNNVKDELGDLVTH